MYVRGILLKEKKLVLPLTITFIEELKIVKPFANSLIWIYILFLFLSKWKFFIISKQL